MFSIISTVSLSTYKTPLTHNHSHHPHLQIKMFFSSLFKVSVLHPFPLRNLHLHHLHTPILDFYEQEALTVAQEYQLERLQAECDSLSVDSKVVGHKVTISAKSLVKIFSVELFC